MAFTIYKWGGRWLRRAAYPNSMGLPGWAIAPACCCVADCCGRLLPGPASTEGPGYYPLTLHMRITAGTCALPSSPLEFDLTWDPSLLAWRNAGPIDAGGYGDITEAKVVCGLTGLWSGSFTWGACFTTGTPGVVQFVAEATLNEAGECEPLDATDQDVAMTGLMCCGSLSGGTVIVDIYE